MDPLRLPRMKPPAAALPRWSTTSIGDSADTQPVELSALGEHVSLCRAAASRYGGLLRSAQVVHGVVAARFVTTLVVMALLIGTLVLVF